MEMSSEEMVKAFQQMQEERKKEAVVRHKINNEMTKFFMETDESMKSLSDLQQATGKGILSSHLEIQKVALKQNEMDFILRGVDGKNGLVSKVNKIEVTMDQIKENTHGMTTKMAVLSTSLAGVCFAIGKLWT